MFHDVYLRLRALRNRRRKESELEDEIRFHLSEEMEDRIGEGLGTDEARAAARRDFGNLTLVREAVREIWSWGSAERLLQDVRYTLRIMRRDAGVTVVAVTTLALGIGANTAIFSLVNGILLRPLPYPEPHRLVAVTGTYPKGAFVELRLSSASMRAAAYAEGHDVNLSGLGEPARLTATLVSAELLSVIGAQPQLGRTFQDGEDLPGRDAYAILSHEVWEQRFSRDPAVVGRTIMLDGRSRQVVGVMPADFRFPSAKTQVWIPLDCDPRSQASYWAGDFMPVIGRLRPNATLEQAGAEVRSFQARAPALFPWVMPTSWNADVSVVPLQTAIVGDARPRLLMLLGVVGLVLLIACANVANITLARAVSRAKEIGVRCALGAGQARIARQLLTESVVVAASGAAVGLIVAVQGLALLKRVLPPNTPRLEDAHVDWRVLAFTGGLAIATGVAFGLAPALHASRTDLAESMKAGGRSDATAISQRLRNGLVVAEIAFAVLLVIAAGLFVRSFWALTHVNAGFQPDRVVTARLTPSPGFCGAEARCLAFYRELIVRMRASPGVDDAALVNTLPLDGRVAKRSLKFDPYASVAAEASPLFWLNIVTPEYFRVMRIPLVAGRAFADADLSGNPPVAIVPIATARRFWPEGSAIGKHVRFAGEREWRTIVGVAGDVRAHDLTQDVPDYMEGAVYVPYSPKATLEDGRVPAEMTVVVLTSEDVARVEATLRSHVARLSREVPVSDARSMRLTVSDAVVSPASVTTLLGTFAAVALVLGVVGIYGVLSFLVSKRTREIGVRMALGARRQDVFRSILKEGVQLALAGVALGMAAAAVTTRAIAGELYGVGPSDPATYLVVAVVMMVATIGACIVPTYRATRVDPLIALRQD